MEHVAKSTTSTKQATIAVAAKYHFYYLLPLSVSRHGKYSSTIKAFSPTHPERGIVSGFWVDDVALSIPKQCLTALEV